MADYKADLDRRYWEYQRSHFPNWQEYFEPPHVQDGPPRPPVFVSSQAWRNVIINPKASQEEIQRLLALLPNRHKWFPSMNSSQALAQSVFGNLVIHDFLHYLLDMNDDEGQKLFGRARLSSNSFAMEWKVNYLGERHSTRLDGYVSGDYRVAIECKFTEAEVGSCSRPRLTQGEPNYESEHCDGTYSFQRARKERCSLTEIGVLYWRYVPSLFKWEDASDLYPCPLYRNYQLVRNVLAAGVMPDGTVSLNNSHVLLIYDERNPAFQDNGNGMAAFKETRGALREPTMLRKCSWQRIVRHLRENDILPWLTENLALKYGL